MVRITINIFIVILIFYALAGGLLALFQEKLIFMGTVLPQDYAYGFSTDFEEVFLESPDGEAKLNALHFKIKDPKGVILYYHGNAGQLADWGLVMQDFIKRGYDVLLMDYRGYGKSTGAMSEEALYSDAELFYDYVAERYPENKIIVYGRSLGTTFATYVAANNNPSQLFLEAPFYSLNRLASKNFPIFPVSWVLKYRFPTYKFITDVECPIVIFHGTDDQMINYENSIKLSELVPADQLRFISIPNGGHNNLVDENGYIEAIDTLLQ